MIGGYNAANSYEKRGKVVVAKRLKGLLIPYAFASAVYVFYNNRFFDATEYLTRLIHFDATGPLYYVAVYAWLVLLTPVLIGVIKWCESGHSASYVARWLFVWILILVWCYVSTHFTNVFNIVIGGGNLFAGPWLFFWFLGMFIHKVDRLTVSFILKIALLAANTAVLVAWQYIFVTKGMNLSLQSIFNGTQVGMTWANAFQTGLLFFWFKDLIGIIEHFGEEKSRKLLMPLDFLGQHTLYIFMYHMLFLGIYRSFLEIPGAANRWFCLIFIFLAPVGVGGLLKWLKLGFSKIMEEVSVI